MGNKTELITELKKHRDDPQKLKDYIIENSNLPGPRGNIELAFALAEVYHDTDDLLQWTEISEEQAGVNDPESFPAFCAAVCLGKIYTNTHNEACVIRLKEMANDNRWRMREAVAFGFQLIGENNFETLNNWIHRTFNNLEKRAILVALAHPKFLSTENTRFCFGITENVLNTMDRNENFDVLKKGLSFVISVYAAANPEEGFRFMKRWINRDKDIDKIIRENLKKKRIAAKYPDEVDKLVVQLRS